MSAHPILLCHRRFCAELEGDHRRYVLQLMILSWNGALLETVGYLRINHRPTGQYVYAWLPLKNQPIGKFGFLLKLDYSFPP